MTPALHIAAAQSAANRGRNFACAVCSGNEAKAKPMARTVPALPKQSN